MAKFNIKQYVKEKTTLLESTSKTFKDIYQLTFRDKDFDMFEYTVNNRVKKLTYGEVEDGIESTAHAIKRLLVDLPKGSIVGLYAQNSITFIEVFWALLKCGFKPLLLNTRIDTDRLSDILSFYKVATVISDSIDFNVKTIKFTEIEKKPYTDKIDDFANEIILMSSGTTLKSKLCVYSGENFYYQLLDSANIVKTCPEIAKHYNGSLKLLMFLPLYHIFGLSAMFMWFSFYQRTFVLLPSLDPEVISYTIRKHKVTHIFAVPLLWETVYKKFHLALSKKEQKVQDKFKKGYAIVKKTKSRFLAKKLFKPVRELIFGDSICFLISGGSGIPQNVLEFFNVIGYHLANGYGMSEVGITSVETSKKFKHLTDCSIGKPFTQVEYKLNDKGELLIKGKSVAKDILINGKVEDRPDGWYNSLDVAKQVDGRYFIMGRADDMIIGPDGENINPEYYETKINLPNAHKVCIAMVDDVPSLIIEINKYSQKAYLDNLRSIAIEQLTLLGIQNVVTKVLFTKDALIGDGDFKLNRRKIAKLNFSTIDNVANFTEIDGELALNLRELFAKALDVAPDTIGGDSHFFFDLNGTSLDYFALLSDVSAEFNVQIIKDKHGDLYTVNDFKNFLETVL